jgi:hypothetical protein
MIILNKIARELMEAAHTAGRINNDSSKMAILLRISFYWRELCRHSGDTTPGRRYLDRVTLADIILECLLLMKLTGAIDVEGDIKKRFEDATELSYKVGRWRCTNAGGNDKRRWRRWLE